MRGACLSTAAGLVAFSWAGCLYEGVCEPDPCPTDVNRACGTPRYPCGVLGIQGDVPSCGTCLPTATCDERDAGSTNLCQWRCPPSTCWWAHGKPEADVRSLFGWGPADIWAGMPQGRVAHWNGSRWDVTRLPAPNNFVRAIWGASPWDAWAAVGNELHHWNGGLWTRHTRLPQNTWSLFGTAHDDVHAVGYQGQLAHWDGSAWTVVGQAPSDMQVVFGAGGVAWAAGTGGVIMRWEDGAWAQVPTSFDTDFNGGWAAAPDQAWVGGGNKVFHWNGESWTSQDLEVQGTINAFFGFSAANVWMAAHGTSLWQWDGARWTHVATNEGKGSAVRALWGASPGDVWAAGDDVGWMRWLPRWPGPERMTQEQVQGL